MVPNIRFGSVCPAAQVRAALPPDLPDDIEARVPEFRSRRKAELLPPLRPSVTSNELDPTWCKALARADWQAGFRWGVVACGGGLTLFAIVAARVLQ